MGVDGEVNRFGHLDNDHDQAAIFDPLLLEALGVIGKHFPLVHHGQVSRAQSPLCLSAQLAHGGLRSGKFNRVLNLVSCLDRELHGSLVNLAAESVVSKSAFNRLSTCVPGGQDLMSAKCCGVLQRRASNSIVEVNTWPMIWSYTSLPAAPRSCEGCRVGSRASFSPHKTNGWDRSGQVVSYHICPASQLSTGRSNDRIVLGWPLSCRTVVSSAVATLVRRSDHLAPVPGVLVLMTCLDSL